LRELEVLEVFAICGRLPFHSVFAFLAYEDDDDDESKGDMYLLHELPSKSSGEITIVLLSWVSKLLFLLI